MNEVTPRSEDVGGTVVVARRQDAELTPEADDTAALVAPVIAVDSKRAEAVALQVNPAKPAGPATPDTLIGTVVRLTPNTIAGEVADDTAEAAIAIVIHIVESAPEATDAAG